ncbi:tRNA pseudouridine synthase A [Canibacter sp. lx-72]|uniref:tRNA pseudouridine synthase A n=1 Tax=Canibacter zhuwentaonis TaxID=2837491 RepID=UPI001BDBE6E6|nr:tRNA pseudouridine synthase A [Canibacter zhuwentaonis]MBT1018634.1 tRNA pseudouridine synthase A [Canibacter zhuwentaonis]MBT1035856.1 tRNA pseudouridine synthase A [Canibacter zhuwentaonis]
MLRLKMVLSYEGTDFHGWAAQPGLRTVQGEVERALNTVLRRGSDNPVQLTVAGRTDAGVHARRQVAHFDIAADELATLLKKGAVTGFDRAGRINGVLKRFNANDVVIRDIAVTVPEFDARFGALWRLYEYRICAAWAYDPLAARHTVTLPGEPDWQLLQEASQSLLGLRDFAAFCKAREGATSVRTLTYFEWREVAPGVRAARIQADAFCHSMARALVGGVIAVASGRITLPQLQELQERAQRTSRFTVMPAHGLSLEEIGYPPESELAARALQTRAVRNAAAT